MSDEESDPSTHIHRTCELAKRYLEEYCRNWTGIDTLRTFSLCVSESHMKCCSNSNSDRPELMPEMGDDFMTSSCLSSCSLVKCQVTEVPYKNSNDVVGLNNHLSYCVLPKDSFEVFKTRKIIALSNKSLESSSFLDYSNHTLDIRSSQDDTRRKRKKIAKRVMISDNDLMNKIASKPYTRTQGILSYGDMKSRNTDSLETDDQVNMGSVNDNPPIRTMSYSESTTLQCTRVDAKVDGNDTSEIPLKQVTNEMELEKVPSIVAFEDEGAYKLLKSRSESNTFQEPPLLMRIKSQTISSHKPIEELKAKSNTSRENTELTKCKWQSDTRVRLVRSRSFLNYSKKQAEVLRSESGSKISHSISGMKGSKSSIPEIKKSTRPSERSLYPVGFNPSRHDHKKLLSSVNAKASNANEDLTHSKTSPSNTTIILSQRHSSLTRLSQGLLNARHKTTSMSNQKTNLTVEENPSRLLIINQPNQLKQKTSKSSFDKSNSFDKFQQLSEVGDPESSSSSDSSSSRSFSDSKLNSSNPEETLHKESSRHFNNQSEFLNLNVVDSKSSPVTIMAESKGKKSEALARLIEPTEPTKATKAAKATVPKSARSDRKSKKETKCAIRGPLAYPPAVQVPWKPRCGPVVKYASPPHINPNSPIRPRSPAAVPVVSGPNKSSAPGTPPQPEPGTPPAPLLASCPPTASALSPAPTPAPGLKPVASATLPLEATPSVPQTPCDPCAAAAPCIFPETTTRPAPNTPPTPGIPLAPDILSATSVPPVPRVLPSISPAQYMPSAPRCTPAPGVPLACAAPLGGRAMWPTEARYATSDKSMQSESTQMRHTITQTPTDLDPFGSTTLSRAEQNASVRSISEPWQPITRPSASIPSTNTIALNVSGTDAATTLAAVTPSAISFGAGPIVDRPPPDAIAFIAAGTEGKPASDVAGASRLPSPTLSNMQMLEPSVSLRIPCQEQRVDYSPSYPRSPVTCPHSPTCNPPCNIPCHHPKKIRPKVKKISHCNLKPCVDLAALEKEKLELEKKYEAQFAAKKMQLYSNRKCSSMCKTPPCYRPNPSKRMNTGTISQPKCASSCRTSQCNPKCRDFPWARITQVSQQASVASVHFADDWQLHKTDYDNIIAPQGYYDKDYCEDPQCDAGGFYKDASMRTDFEETVIKVDKGLNYKQVPIYEHGRLLRRNGPPVNLNHNSTLFAGYDCAGNHNPYYDSGQKCAYGYGPINERPLVNAMQPGQQHPSYAAGAYNPVCDRQYANYNQYQNYDPYDSGQYYGENSINYDQNSTYDQWQSSYDRCQSCGNTCGRIQPCQDQQSPPMCTETNNCQNSGEDQFESDDVENNAEKCANISVASPTISKVIKRRRDNCLKSCSYKPEMSHVEIDTENRKKKKEVKGPPKPQSEFVVPQINHPCKPIVFGKDVCPPVACPPASQCPFSCTGRGKISGLHLRQEPNVVPKKICDPTCKAWNKAEQSSKTGLWDHPSRQNEVVVARSVEAIVNSEQQSEIHKKVIDSDGETLVDKRDYITHHSTPVLNNMFEMSQPVTVNDLRSVGKLLPEAKKEDNETSLTNMFEINFNLRVTRGDKTTEISIANEDDTEKTKTPKDSQELLVLKSENPKVIEENPPNDINIRIMIKSYKPKIEKPPREITVNDFSKEIFKKFHTVSTGSKLTGTEEMADHVYSVHRATINLAADSSEVSKIKNECKDQTICSKILLSPSIITEKGDAILDKELKTDEIESSKSLFKSDLPSDTTANNINAYQEVMVNFPDNVISETVNTINAKYATASSERKSSSLQNIYLHSIQKDDSVTKSESMNLKVIRLYKSDANIYGTDTEPDVSSINKTSTEQTDDDNKTSDDNLNLKLSDEHTLDDIILALKSSTEPTSGSQKGIKEDEPFFSEEERDTLQVKMDMIKAIFEKASLLKKKSKGKNRMRKLQDMLKLILTSDSSDPEDIVASSYFVKDRALKPNVLKDSDSLNNYLTVSGKQSVIQVQCNTVEAASNGSGGDSEWSLETSEGKTANQCICSAVAARLKSYDNNMSDIACCCQKSMKADQQISCDLIPPFIVESSSVERVDVEIQNKFLSSKIIINQSVEIAAPPSNFFILNNPIVAQAESICLKSKESKEKKIREVTIKRSKMSFMPSGVIKEFDLRRYNKAPKLGISDDDKIIFFETQPIAFPNLRKGSRRKKEKRPLNWQQPADILQLYETKKAVLEIYTEKKVTEDGECLVAKLPKFVDEEDTDIYKNRDKKPNHYKGFRSLCKTNIVMMSFTR